MKTAIGILLASVAMFFWGFLYWGINPLPLQAWKKAPSDAPLQSALMANLPESGIYHLPTITSDKQRTEEEFKKGPIAFIVFDREGKQMMDPMIMVKGFLHMLVTVSLLALLLSKAAPALPTYGRRVGFIALAGFTAAFFVHLGDAIWWRMPLLWQLHHFLFSAVAWTAAGAILAKFVKPNERAG